MPMNEQPPWGKKKKPSGPEDFLATLIQKLKDTFAGAGQKPPRDNRSEKDPDGPPNFLGGASKILAVVVVIVLIQAAMSAFYTVKPGEVGVILRFGKFTKATTPGLHFKMPYIDRLIKVDMETIRKEEFGFRTRTTTMGNNLDRRGLDNESLMLTGDQGVIEVAWIVQYKVENAQDFLFKVRDVPQALRDASETVTRRIVGNMDFDFILSNRDILALNARQELQDQMNRLECGIAIVALQLLDISPPDPVRPAFNEVNEADQDMKRLVNEAEEVYNRIIPAARGNARQIVEEARGYSFERVNRAMGETTRFVALVQEYERARDVTRQRLYLETMSEVLPTVEHVYIMDQSQNSLLPLLDLTRQHGKETAIGAE
ncbi:FtsH protease activity modulator HflK [Desulfobulbus alkaliphilus]|nr:FtsH protease activity modulator HflK [Desulfobulbus alkaliphilus]